MTELIYIASRASLPERVAEWRRYRDRLGVRIVSSWIDEAEEGETEDFGDLWERIGREILLCDKLVLYAETNDFPLKGALVEVGMAIASRKRIVACLPGVRLEERTLRPVGSWLASALVSRNDDISTALGICSAK